MFNHITALLANMLLLLSARLCDLRKQERTEVEPELLERLVLVLGNAGKTWLPHSSFLRSSPVRNTDVC